MSTMTVTAARSYLPQLVDRVQKGEEVTLTRHGVPVITLVKPEIVAHRRAAAAWEQADRLEQLLVKARTRSLGDGDLSIVRADELAAAVRAERDDR